MNSRDNDFYTREKWRSWIYDAAKDAFPSGPARLKLIGPPGTGKTRTSLQDHIIPAIREHGPQAVLALSFSRAAANELRTRLAAALEIDIEDLRGAVSTVHAEALRRLTAAGLANDLTLLAGKLPPTLEADAEAERDNTEARAAFGRKPDSLEAAALKLWSLARSRGVTDPGSIELLRLCPHDLDLLEARRAICAYERRKAELKAVDFADLLRLACTVPAPHRALLLLDEAQDSSGAQWRLIDRWAAAADRVVIVGDEDQLVHAWAGADRRRLQELPHEGYEVRVLAQSYRVPAEPHRWARSIVQRIRSRVDAEYEPADRRGSVRWRSRAEVLAALRDEQSPAFILARSGRILRSWAADLRDQGVAFAGPESPLGSEVARARARALLDLCQGRAADRGDLRELLEALPVRGRSYWPGPKTRTLKAFAAGRKPTLTVEQLRELHLIDLSGLVALGLERGLNEVRVAHVEYLARLIQRLGREVLTTAPRLELLTAHRSKGREADLVVIDLEAPTPVRKALERMDAGVRDAELRLLYVAATRTRDRLILVPPKRSDWLAAMGAPLPRGAA